MSTNYYWEEAQTYYKEISIENLIAIDEVTIYTQDACVCYTCSYVHTYMCQCVSCVPLSKVWNTAAQNVHHTVMAESMCDNLEEAWQLGKVLMLID